MTTTRPARALSPARAAPRGDLGVVLPVVLVVVVALALRLVPLLRGAGLYGNAGYDDAVEYSAAVGLAYGRLPYQDFLLLHPPGLLLVLAPFAVLGRYVGDPDAFALARLVFVGLGVLNTGLVMRVLRPCGRLAVVAGGACYAVYFPNVATERTTVLEPVATTCVLVAVLLLRPGAGAVGDRPVSPRALLLAGALVGAAAGVKIWGVVVVGTLVGWALLSLGRRAGARLAVGSALGVTVVCLPFFLAAPTTMWQMVVADQLGRPPAALSLTRRLGMILGLTPLGAVGRATPVVVAAVVLLLVIAAAACTVRVGRLGAALLVTCTAVLVLTPSFFLHYAALDGAPLALVVGAGSAVLLHRVRRRTVRVRVAGGVALAALVVNVPVVSTPYGRPFPAAVTAALADTRGCVTTDSPISLVESGALARNLERGCPLVVDVSGYSYHLSDRPGLKVDRRLNRAWQAFALDYLGSGDRVVMMRFRDQVSFDTATAREVERWPVVVRTDSAVVRAPDVAGTR